MKPTAKGQNLTRLLLLFFLLIISMLLALRYGSSEMGWGQFWRALILDEGYKTQSVILYSVRLPRLLGGVIAGAGLAVSGVLLQAVTANDLASPSIIGVNSGAGVVVMLMLYFFPGAVYMLAPAAFLGALFATLLILAVAMRMGFYKSSMILAGIALTTVLGAIISLLSLLDTDTLASYTYFSVGGLSGVQLKSLVVPAALVITGIFIALIISHKIGLLRLGDEVAQSLGVRVKSLRFLCLVISSALAASAVSFAGLIGFVGLIVPHMSRRMLGGSMGVQIAGSALCGSLLVVLCDLVGRVVLKPTELPVGILLSLIGAPFFFYLLLKRQRQV